MRDKQKILNQLFRFLKQKLVLKRFRVKIFEIFDSIFISNLSYDDARGHYDGHLMAPESATRTPPA